MHKIIDIVIRILKTIISLLEGRQAISNVMLISYEKINAPKNGRTGYDFDMGNLLKRYQASIETKIKMDTLIKDNAVSENLFFLEKETIKHIGLIKRNSKFLDVGCGSGIYSKILTRNDSPFRHIKYYGCEINSEIVNICNKFNAKASFFVSFAEKVNKPDKYFDFILYSGILHYSQTGWKNVLKDMERVAKRYVYITRTPVTKRNKTFYVHQRVVGVDGIENHYFVVLNRDELENELVRNGFKIVVRDYSSEIFNVKGVEEKIVLVQYLLEKK
ncbi:MAG: class I SAM-dependent methyltransferase [bacterium]|nr:MAG: class I SAM-dependent methyltransferase [bacterium]